MEHTWVEQPPSLWLTKYRQRCIISEVPSPFSWKWVTAWFYPFISNIPSMKKWWETFWWVGCSIRNRSQAGLAFTGTALFRPTVIPPPLFPFKSHICHWSLCPLQWPVHGGLFFSRMLQHGLSESTPPLSQLRPPYPLLAVIDLAVLWKCSRWLQSSLRSSLWLLWCCLYLAHLPQQVGTQS